MNETVAALIQELQSQDKEVTQANAQMRLARVHYDIAIEKYQAVRDLVLERLGRNPYVEPIEEKMYEFASGGRFRLLGLPAGEAALTVLKEAKGGLLTLEEIAARARAGGAGYLPRMFNAALMQMKNIDKPEEGKYRYVDPAYELPFDQ